MKRQLGRQLTRVGALSQQLRLLPAAELSLRMATYLLPEPAWYVRLGLVYEARKQWEKAESIYIRSLSARSADNPRYLGIAHYRLARLHVRRKDWGAAEENFSEALRLRPTIAVWHVHRAQSREGRQDWDGAVDSYREAVRLEPDKAEWTTLLVRCFLKARRVPDAVEAGAAGLQRTPGNVPLMRAVADAYEAAGDWQAAAEVVRKLIAQGGAPDYPLRSQLVRCLANLYRVPFRLGPDGAVTEPAAPQPAGWEEALTEAVDTLRYMSTHPSASVPDLVRLGILYERSDRFDSAAETYRLAVSRLATVDSWWCHKTAYDLAYRLDYVEEQLRPADPPRRDLHRAVAPATSSSSTREPAGFFDALIARDGLQVSGFLLPTDSEFVEFRLDDLLLKQIRVYATPWRPTFRFDISKGTLRGFPERSRLSVLVDGRPLVTVDGAQALEVRIAGGTSRILKDLRDGRALTKKGHWPLSGSKLAERRQRYLDIYARTGDLLERRGRQLFLCYGTLLGCHREAGFIAGDDDFDASYVSTAATPTDYRRECYETALGLLDDGLDIAFAINGRMFKVGTERVWIDVGPIWFHRGRGLSFVAHDITPEVIEPLRPTTFSGRKVYIPQNADAFLADTYGADWRTPRQDFRYYRSKEDNRLLSQMWARPSEVREFARKARQAKERNPDAGDFLGIGYPAYPGFNWLVTSEGRMLAADRG